MAATNDQIVAKLALIYPSTPRHIGDLLKAYWSDAGRGNNGGKPKGGDSLFAHFGGAETTLGDKANRFWGNVV
jgi:hypothetical protein